MWKILKSKVFVFLILSVLLFGLFFSYKKYIQIDREVNAFSVCLQVSMMVWAYNEKNDEMPKVLSDLVVSGLISLEDLESWEGQSAHWESQSTLSVKSSFVEHGGYIFTIITPRKLIGVKNDGMIFSWTEKGGWTGHGGWRD